MKSVTNIKSHYLKYRYRYVHFIMENLHSNAKYREG
jgi:hypothetical protein